ncbi:hypothetical protein COCVIDRAFT_99465 [Bipolaris victoriae FI3]|uniref:Uncharacterized protein n=2 Tax=Bipolaris TaxID=33194 RepID=W6YRE1_COCC2|nr:uncharacterized protein COCCADRAFT_84314 [Bipolaris zeicola 26-R-13]XP_014556529.1 hypothetical protein COCVIDRAFT_99465 [Bipolaris victoriae FI3]EUC37984.1 hypothetical protein COCCADRAFT_84314 [Bipolaris zeicola 26-R-13]
MRTVYRNGGGKARASSQPSDRTTHPLSLPVHPSRCLQRRFISAAFASGSQICRNNWSSGRGSRSTRSGASGCVLKARHSSRRQPLTNRTLGTLLCSRIERGRRDWLGGAVPWGGLHCRGPIRASSLRRGRKKGNFSAA